MAPSLARFATTALDEKVEAQRVKLEQLKVRQVRLRIRLQFPAAKQARLDKTWRKLMIGATILAKIERGKFDRKKRHAMLDEALTRKDDRALFGL
jgi:hypothetical protein